MDHARLAGRFSFAIAVLAVILLGPSPSKVGAQEEPSVSIESTVDPSIIQGPSGVCSDAIRVALHNGSVTLSRQGDASDELIVPFSLGGTAVRGVDYDVESLAARFAADATSAVVTFTPRGSGDPRTIVFTIEPGAGYRIEGEAEATLTIAAADNGIGCGPPTFIDATSNVAQTVNVGDALAALQAAPFDGGGISFKLDSGGLPSGVELTADGTFTGTATRPGRFVAVIGACTPAFVPPLPPSQLPSTCALTQLTVTVLGATLPATGPVAKPLISVGLGLAVLGALAAAWSSQRRKSHMA